MKYVACFVLVSFVCCLFLPIEAEACSVVVTPLRKQFRDADSVFVASILSVTDDATPEQVEKDVPKEWKPWLFSRVSLKIGNVWKGSPTNGAVKEFVAVAFRNCGCEIRKFEIGKEYLIFAATKHFVSICDTDALDLSDVATAKMRRLNSFWFRTWARLNPF